MNDPVRLERHGNIALIVIDNPPVNVITKAVRIGLLRAVEEADADESIDAIALLGHGKAFLAGSDIREFEQARREPILADVLSRLEACRKPVIAGLHGAVLGGGCETALACHYRCASPNLELGLPEVKLGVLPGAGAAQRLPRLTGVLAALEIMTSGEPIGLLRAQQLGLIDEVVESDDMAEALLAYTRKLSAGGSGPRRVRDMPLPEAHALTPEFFDTYRWGLSRPARRSFAIERIVQCVEATVALPFDEAVERSRALFEECRASPESSALRHLFFAERGSRSSSFAGVPKTPTRRVAVIGAGTMGSGIAATFAIGGFEVCLIDVEAAAVQKGLERIQGMLDSAVRKARLTQDGAVAARALVRVATETRAASDSDLVIEAVFESLSLKQDLLRQLDVACKPGAVLATNTSTLDVDAIAAVTSRPSDVLGMHFFSPANVMRLVEIVRGRATSEQAVAMALSVAKRLGKIGVVVGNCYGFVGNRMLYAYGRENQNMLLEGATPEQIDRALEAWGMAMGPNAVGDLAGLDVGYRARRERANPPEDPRYFRIADLLVEQGRLGQKTGKGFYTYEGGASARRADPEVHELIRAEGKRLGIPQREISDAEIVERCLYALINEGARILDEGIVSRPADIDVIWANGYGFPRARGGPMYFAEQQGWSRVLGASQRGSLR